MRVINNPQPQPEPVPVVELRLGVMSSSLVPVMLEVAHAGMDDGDNVNAQG